jgi:N-acetylglucosaminyl-diphospho-decaprenol L-rhamnosyltransferase
LILSIIIVSWNTRELLEGCLTSIYAHPPHGEFEVFVVDNASSDGSAQMVEEHFPPVRLIENSENIGFARANNLAIQQGIGRYVLLLNPDTEVKPGAIEALVEFMDDNPRAGAAGSCLLSPNDTLQPSCHPEPTISRELWRLFHLDKLYPYAIYPIERWDLKTPRLVDALQGACIILRRKALDQVGLLDEDFFIYSEEVDLCYRLRKSGWEIFWVPQSRVVHLGGQSTQQASKEMFLHLYRGKLLYFRKHHGWLAALIYKAILISAGFARLLVTPLAWFEQPSARQRHLTLARNYIRMLKVLPGM